MPQVIDDLTAQVGATTTVIDSAVALINGIQTRIDDAVKAAIANGATAEQLAPLADLSTTLKNEDDKLAAAVAANTPAAAPAPAAPAP